MRNGRDSTISGFRPRRVSRMAAGMLEGAAWALVLWVGYDTLFGVADDQRRTAVWLVVLAAGCASSLASIVLRRGWVRTHLTPGNAGR